jgi:hypothetical protein
VYHYKNGCDIYLFLNEDPVKRFSGSVTVEAMLGREKNILADVFTCGHKGDAVMYDAWRNRLVKVDRIGKDGTALSLELEPLELAVVIIGENLPKAEERKFLENSEVIQLTDFTVSIAQAKERPNFHSPKPADLEHGMGRAHPGFSGFYRYETEVWLSQQAPLNSNHPQSPLFAMLEIEDAYESVEVFINGASCGILVAKPYKFELSCLREGRNSIAIEVATTLERKMAAMGVDVACRSFLAPLSPAGIVGKVALRALNAQILPTSGQ